MYVRVRRDGDGKVGWIQKGALVGKALFLLLKSEHPVRGVKFHIHTKTRVRRSFALSRLGSTSCLGDVAVTAISLAGALPDLSSHVAYLTLSRALHLAFSFFFRSLSLSLSLVLSLSFSFYR